MLQKAAEEIENNHQALSRLDSFGGDGDHGTTILRAMKKMLQATEDSGSDRFKDLLSSIAWAVMGVDGGATGPLFGSLFMGMSEAAGDKTSLDAADVARMFEQGLEEVKKYTKAEPGDKTLMDALVPAVAALGKEAEATDDLERIFEAAARAAGRGADATKEYQARFGRSKNAGEKSIGEKDPGAVSLSLIFKGLSTGINSKE